MSVCHVNTCNLFQPPFPISVSNSTPVAVSHFNEYSTFMAAQISFTTPIMNVPSAARTSKRILCLHGYQQNGDMLRARTGAWRKALHQTELVYIDAPHAAQSGFTWWNASDDGTCYEGWEHSLAHIEHTLEHSVSIYFFLHLHSFLFFFFPFNFSNNNTY